MPGVLTPPVLAVTLEDLGRIGEFLAGAAAAITLIFVIIGWLLRLTWPTAIRWVHAYSLSPDTAEHPDLVLNTRVLNRRKQKETLLHYYVVLIPWTRRIRPGWRLRGHLDEIDLEPCAGYEVPPTIPAQDGATTWCRVVDGDLLLSCRRAQLLFGEKSYRYRTLGLIGRDTWHPKLCAYLVTGIDGRKATRRVRRRSGVPGIPVP